MKIRIENDGDLAYNTKVLDSETGQMVTLVKRVIVDFDVSHPVASAIMFIQADKELMERWRLHSTSAFPQVDVIANAEVKHICPHCGQFIEPPPLQGDVPEQFV